MKNDDKGVVSPSDGGTIPTETMTDSTQQNPFQQQPMEGGSETIQPPQKTLVNDTQEVVKAVTNPTVDPQTSRFKMPGFLAKLANQLNQRSLSNLTTNLTKEANKVLQKSKSAPLLSTAANVMKKLNKAQEDEEELAKQQALEEEQKLKEKKDLTTAELQQQNQDKWHHSNQSDDTVAPTTSENTEPNKHQTLDPSTSNQKKITPFPMELKPTKPDGTTS